MTSITVNPGVVAFEVIRLNCWRCNKSQSVRVSVTGDARFWCSDRRCAAENPLRA